MCRARRPPRAGLGLAGPRFEPATQARGAAALAPTLNTAALVMVFGNDPWRSRSEERSRLPCSRTRSHCGGHGSGAACLAHTACRHARWSIPAALPVGRCRSMDSFSLAVSVAHPGHMKREKLRGDSWNLVPARPRKAARKSQVLADSWRVGEIRECQADSLPRRRSPVRTRARRR